MPEVSLHGGLERPLHEAVKLKPGLPQKSQDVGDARAMGYRPRRAANRVWNQAKRAASLQSTELKGIGDLKSPLTSDMEM